jgi:hypothetical protein
MFSARAVLACAQLVARCAGDARICARLVARCALLPARARGSLRSGRGGRRGRLAPCRGYEMALVWVGDLAAIRHAEAPHERPGRSYCPQAGTRRARTLAGRASPARTDARCASVPGARRPRLPPLTSGAEMGRDPEGSCAAAPSRAWLQQRRLRSPAHCVGTRRRRLRPRRRGHGGAVLTRAGGEV